MSTMASTTTSTAPVPPEVLAKPAARALSEALGYSVLSIEDFRGDLAITVERKAWVEAARRLGLHAVWVNRRGTCWPAFASAWTTST